MILISIQPEHCKNIFNGSKRIEWRTKPLPIGRAAVYCTQSKLPDKRYLYTNPERVKINFGNFSKWSVKQNELSINDNTAYKFTCYLANGKVIGEIEVIRTLKYATVNDIPESVIMAGCVSREFLQAYSKGKPIYANYIDNVKLYDEPKELGEFKKADGNNPKCGYSYCCKAYCGSYDYCTAREVTRPPQSYMRIQDPKEM